MHYAAYLRLDCLQNQAVVIQHWIDGFLTAMILFHLMGIEFCYRYTLFGTFNTPVQCNRSFYSCLFSFLVFEWQQGCRWPCFDTVPLYLLRKSSCSYATVVGIYMRKAERFASKHCNSSRSRTKMAYIFWSIHLRLFALKTTTKPWPMLKRWIKAFRP